MDLMVKSTEYEEQEKQTEKDISKWKEKYKMLMQYKKEEEVNFRPKFEELIRIEEKRARLKAMLSKVKNN